jgi:hypothetical protein
MTYLQALEIVVRNTGVDRYRHLCSEANTLPPPNDYEAYRGLMLRLAGAELTPNPDAVREMIGEIRAAANDAPEHLHQPVPCCGGGI